MAEAFIYPSDTELEKSILNQILLDAIEAAECMDSLEMGDFFSRANQQIFESMHRIFKSLGAVGIAEVLNDMRSRGTIESCGGTHYILDLMDQVPPVSTSNAVSILKKLSVRRRMIEICNAGLKRALGDPDAIASVDYLQAEAMRLEPEASQGNCVSMGRELEVGLKRWHKVAAAPGNLTGVCTGVRQLDFMTCGFQPTDLVILAARPSMGKTAMSIGWARAAAESGKRVLYFSLEQSRAQLATRLVSSETHINSHKFKTGYFAPGDINMIEASVRKLADIPFLMDDSAALSASEIRRRTRRVDRKTPVDIVFIDHLQLISSPDSKENRNIELGDITRSLKAMAKELGIPVVVLSQLNRNLESRPDKRPRLSDLRESGSIEQDADVVAFIYRPEHYGLSAEKNHFEGYTEISIGKHRDGPTGVVLQKFNPRSVRFFDVEKEQEQRIFSGRPASGQK
jgi:replicative DNA helicase